MNLVLDPVECRLTALCQLSVESETFEGRSRAGHDFRWPTAVVVVTEETGKGLQGDRVGIGPEPTPAIAQFGNPPNPHLASGNTMTIQPQFGGEGRLSASPFHQPREPGLGILQRRERCRRGITPIGSFDRPARRLRFHFRGQLWQTSAKRASDQQRAPKSGRTRVPSDHAAESCRGDATRPVKK